MTNSDYIIVFILFILVSYERRDVTIRWQSQESGNYNGITMSEHFRALNAYLIYNHTSDCETAEVDWRGKLM